MSYFTSVTHTETLSYAINSDRGVSFWDYFGSSRTKITIWDNGMQNSLSFYLPTTLAIAERVCVCEIVRSIALEAAGNIRKLSEHAAIGLLVKQYDMCEIDHFSVARQEIKTLWTQDDYLALNA